MLEAPNRSRLVGLLLAVFLAGGLLGTYRYVDNYWLYRGFPPPHAPGYVTEQGTPLRFYLASPALGGRRQPIDVYLPPGYRTHPARPLPGPFPLLSAPPPPAGVPW